MAEVVFDSGIRSLDIRDDAGHSVTISYNPYDVLFLGGLMDAAEKLDAEQTRLQSMPTDDWRKVYRAAMDADKVMKGVLDEAFGAPVCEALFPHQTVHAIGNGLPAWANLLYAVIDSMDAGMEAEKSKAQERIRKYSAKYRR